MVIGLNSGLFVGLSGVRASQASLNIVGNNMANVNTPGYSRRQAQLTVGPSNSDGRLSVGGGVNLEGVMAARNTITDRTLLEEKGRFSFNRERNLLLAEIESNFADTEFSGIGLSMERLFVSLEEATFRPENTALRQDVLAAGANLAAQIRDKHSRMSQLQQRTDSEVQDITNQINQVAENIFKINKRINTAGEAVENLVDERYRLTQELSELVEIETFELPNNQIQINLKAGNHFLLSGATLNTLSTQLNGTNNNYADVVMNTTAGSTVITRDLLASDTESGQLSAKLQLRDGELPANPDGVDFPSLKRKLDMLAFGLMDQFNTVHSAGFDLGGGTGNNFFETFVPGAVGDIDRYEGAATAFAMSSDLLNNNELDPTLLAFSDAGTSGTGEIGNNTNLLGLVGLRNNRAVIDTTGDGVADSGTFEGYFDTVTTELGITVAASDADVDSQSVLTEQAQIRRDQLSAVSLDEEAVDMTRYQRAFQASSRFINTIDELTGDIISSLG